MSPSILNRIVRMCRNCSVRERRSLEEGKVQHLADQSAGIILVEPNQVRSDHLLRSLILPDIRLYPTLTTVEVEMSWDAGRCDPPIGKAEKCCGGRERGEKLETRLAINHTSVNARSGRPTAEMHQS
jgi:hypothetical protein